MAPVIRRLIVAGGCRFPADEAAPGLTSLGSDCGWGEREGLETGVVSLLTEPDRVCGVAEVPPLATGVLFRLPTTTTQCTISELCTEQRV